MAVSSNGGAIKAVIYDCDGVMFDSFEANLAFYQRIMEMMGRPRLSRDNEEQMRILHTYANREVLAHFFPSPGDWEEAVRCAGAIDYRELVPLMIMEEGFREALDTLKGRVGLGVCTNRSTSMDMVLRLFSLDSYFSIVMTASRVTNPKPHPEPLLKVLEHFGIGPREALFVGDSEVDRLSAEAAGVPFVAYKAPLPAAYRMEHHREIIDLLG
ncbi:HAD-IA family hydrolase [Geobacter sulfurreducens]|jgi:phosphoglycolate phosphatase|nr:HAD-IA family hydrolase [Geobacter sulfurreducens]QVW34008.1 HAD-IA family hydrolase [Geobacter sulfurreducens]UAC02797.1 HAD family hydrolase [Geobacter sulfurreducens]UTG91522.1 HAD-IA family hydrolase [Geobacter sulfurreducens]